MHDLLISHIISISGMKMPHLFIYFTRFNGNKILTGRDRYYSDQRKFIFNDNLLIVCSSVASISIKIKEFLLKYEEKEEINPEQYFVIDFFLQRWSLNVKIIKFIQCFFYLKIFLCFLIYCSMTICDVKHE